MWRPHKRGGNGQNWIRMDIFLDIGYHWLEMGENGYGSNERDKEHPDHAGGTQAHR